MTKTVPLLCSLLILSVTALADEPALKLDFEDNSVNAVQNRAAEGQIQIVEASAVPGAPFGADAGRVLALEKGPDHDILPRSTWTFGPMTSGELTLKVATPASDDFSTPLLNIFLLQDTQKLIGPSVYISKGTIYVRDGEQWRSYDGFWDMSALNEVRIGFYDDRSYRLWVNDTPVPDEGRRFRFHMDQVQYISSLQLAIASSTNFASRVYVDDLAITHRSESDSR